MIRLSKQHLLWGLIETYQELNSTYGDKLQEKAALIHQYKTGSKSNHLTHGIIV